MVFIAGKQGRLSVRSRCCPCQGRWMVTQSNLSHAEVGRGAAAVICCVFQGGCKWPCLVCIEVIFDIADQLRGETFMAKGVTVAAPLLTSAWLRLLCSTFQRPWQGQHLERTLRRPCLPTKNHRGFPSEASVRYLVSWLDASVILRVANLGETRTKIQSLIS